MGAGEGVARSASRTWAWAHLHTLQNESQAETENETETPTRTGEEAAEEGSRGKGGAEGNWECHLADNFYCQPAAECF